MTGWYCWEGSDLVLTVRLQPRASRDEIVGPHGGNLKVRVTAPPVAGRANAHLLRLLAKTFGVRRHAVTLVGGGSSRAKRIRIERPARLPPVAGIAGK